MLDVCVVGHVTRDSNRVDDRRYPPGPGGTAYYAGMAYRALGLSTAVVTRMRRQDRAELLGGTGLEIRNLASSETTHFENIYSRCDEDSRRQKVRSVGDPFGTADLAGLEARVFHFGPLLRDDMPPGLLKAAHDSGALVVLDAQGLVRKLRGESVEEEEWSEFGSFLGWVDVLKASVHEICLLGGVSGGDGGEPLVLESLERLAGNRPSETLVTAGSKGAWVHHRGGTIRIPAFHPEHIVDTTGCGDTFTAGYVTRRLQSAEVEASARYAAALAAVKLESLGPVLESGGVLEDRVRAFLSTRES